MLNRQARFAGMEWKSFGAVGFIDSARELLRGHDFAETPNGREYEVEVRCESDPDRICCFKMRRRVEWDCLNPRLGADDPQLTYAPENGWSKSDPNDEEILLRVPDVKQNSFPHVFNITRGDSPKISPRAHSGVMNSAFNTLAMKWPEYHFVEADEEWKKLFRSLNMFRCHHEGLNWLGVVMKCATQQIRQNNNSPASMKVGMLDWLRQQRELVRQWCEASDPSYWETKIQVQLPTKVPLKWKSDYFGEWPLGGIKKISKVVAEVDKKIEFSRRSIEQMANQTNRELCS